MLLKDPIYYYSRIREHYKNSYLAEDTLQVIIGIDCEYVDSYEHNYKSLEQFYKSQKSIAPFAGLFGTFAYETIHYFEKIDEIESASVEVTWSPAWKITRISRFGRIALGISPR